MNFNYHFKNIFKIFLLPVFFFSISSLNEQKNCTKEVTTKKDKKTEIITEETTIITPCDNPHCPAKKNGFK